jgi:hypothetical protein
MSNFLWQDIVLSAPKGPSVQLKAVTTTVEIYESLEKPYLTGLIEFIDAANVFSDYNIEGSEKITITWVDDDPQAKSFTKTFFVDKVVSVSRSNGNTQSVVLHLVEDIAYVSNLQYVNRSYKGNSSNIISKISKDFLNKEVIGSDTDTNSIKVIVPNLSPIEAMEWLRNDATTTEGYPFYLFSTLIDKELLYFDLGTLITRQAFNADTPYVWDPSILSHPLEEARVKKILSFTVNNTENLYEIIKRGFVGSNYELINVLSGERTKIKFDVMKDAFTDLAKKLNKNQSNINYSPTNRIETDTKTAIDGKYFSNLNSASITQIGTSRIFDTSDDKSLSYGEKSIELEYRRNIISRALQSFMYKSSITFAVEGMDFLNGEKSYTIGNTCRLLFNTSDADDSRPNDKKLSGDYLITEAQHIFKKERYDVKFTGLKLANYDT